MCERRRQRNAQTSLLTGSVTDLLARMAEFAAPSVVDLDEAELCRWLFSQPFLSAQLCQKLGVSGPSQVFFGTETKRITPEARGPGDIDILVGDPSRPEAITVIEAKRVKIFEDTFTTKTPTKLASCAGGVLQANLLGKLAFHRTWLLVVVATDGRERPGANFFSRGITFELMDIVRGHSAFRDLAPQVGLIFVYLDQPVDKEIDLAGGFGFDVRREPMSVNQPEVITVAAREWLAAIRIPSE